VCLRVGTTHNLSRTIIVLYGLCRYNIFNCSDTPPFFSWLFVRRFADFGLMSTVEPEIMEGFARGIQVRVFVCVFLRAF